MITRVIPRADTERRYEESRAVRIAAGNTALCAFPPCGREFPPSSHNDGATANRFCCVTCANNAAEAAVGAAT